MAWSIKQPGFIGGTAITETGTKQKFPLGMTVEAYDATNENGTFIYLKGAASTVAEDWVLIKADDYTAPRLVNSHVAGGVAVAMSANTASNYGWYCIRGKVPADVGVNLADGATLYMTSSAGRLDDAAVTGDMVHGAISAATTGGSSNSADCDLNYPHLVGPEAFPP